MSVQKYLNEEFLFNTELLLSRLILIFKFSSFQVFEFSNFWIFGKVTDNSYFTVSDAD